MNTDLNNYKERVKRLRKAVSSVLNIECSQSQAYEILAKEENYPNWDALSGVIIKKEIEQEQSALTSKEQITQLFLLHEGLNNGCAFADILPILREQTNPIIRKGWCNVKIPSTYKDFHQIFEQTGFFNEEVLTILKISIMTGEISTGVGSAIRFLKMNNE